MQPTRINPPELFDSRPYGFSQMVVTPSGARMIHMSGQVAWNAQEEIAGKDDLYAQVVQSLRNIETALRHVDATLDNVVALRIYIKQSHMHVPNAVSRGLKEVFGENLPCATWIGVPTLANEEFLVEIEPTIMA
ncbi:MAG: hypothetical protein KDE20_17205 [Caldilineaceae bacterium]|nr:hypothetical protein [Caldilineaceae bacterium]